MEMYALEQLKRLELFVQQKLEHEAKAREAFDAIFDGSVPPLKSEDWDNVIQMCAGSIDQIFYSAFGDGGREANENIDTLNYFVYEVLMSSRQFEGVITFQGVRYPFRTAEELFPALVAMNKAFYDDIAKPAEAKEDPSLRAELENWKKKYADLYQRFTLIDTHYQQELNSLRERLSQSQSKAKKDEEPSADDLANWRQFYRDMLRFQSDMDKMSSSYQAPNFNLTDIFSSFSTK